MPEKIIDPLDPRVADYYQLTDSALRKKIETEHGLFIAESEKVIRRALTAGYKPRSLLLSERWLDPLADLVSTMEQAQIPVFVAHPEVIAQFTGFHVHRGALAALLRSPLPSISAVTTGAQRLLIIEDVVDHTNLGAIFRSAAALGTDGILVTPRCADPLYRRAIRVSMGTVFQVPWTRIVSWPATLKDLQKSGWTIAGLALTPDAIALDELAAQAPEKLALILGTEGDGLWQRTLAEVDIAVRIPMSGGVDSLNVAAASAVALYTLRTSN